MSKVYPIGLLWLDFESDSLPDGNDFSNVNILEVGAVTTDFDLMKFKGYHDVIKLEKKHVENVKKSPEILEMHKKSGLLEDCAKSELTLEEMEDGLIQLLKDSTFVQGEAILAGSGVAAFDHPLIKEKMPRLAEWLPYYSIDIGILRRVTYYLSARRQFIPHVDKSRSNKAHRGMDDILAHIEEAEHYKDWLRSLP